jgi:hypothetical protein
MPTCVFPHGGVAQEITAEETSQYADRDQFELTKCASHHLVWLKIDILKPINLSSGYFSGCGWPFRVAAASGGVIHTHTTQTHLPVWLRQIENN